MPRLSDQELFTLADVAALLAMSERSVLKLVKAGLLAEGHKIPGVRAIRWFRLEVENCLHAIRYGLPAPPKPQNS